MTRDEVNALAKKAGIWVHPRKNEARFGLGGAIGDDCTPELQRFADLVIEMYAKVAEDLYFGNPGEFGDEVAAAIRARKDSA